MKKSSEKGIIHLLPVVIVGLVLIAVVAFFFFGPGQEGVGIGPPPSESEARKEWLAEKIKPMDSTTIKLGVELPTWKELDALNATLPERTYPEYIKATQTYGTTPNLVEALYFGDELADLGANTMFVHSNYWFKNGELELWYQEYNGPMVMNQDKAKRALVHNILLAREQGLAVILFPDYQSLEDGGMSELGVSDDLEGRLEAIALANAEIAEKYNVEYLVPVNQIEAILFSNNYDVAEIQDRTNAFYASVVPQVKQVYSGKVLYKMGGFGDWDNYDEISLAGADLFGFTGCYNGNRNSIDFITDDIKLSSAQASKMSQEYGIPWINAEFIISDLEHTTIPSFGNETAELLPIEDYYAAALPAFDEYGSDASGFTVHSLLSDGQVYGTPAWPLIKDFFASK